MGTKIKKKTYEKFQLKDYVENKKTYINWKRMK
jgi:hypothetical protein